MENTFLFSSIAIGNAIVFIIVYFVTHARKWPGEDKKKVKMSGIKIGKRYQIQDSGYMYDLPYAGRTGTLIKIIGNLYQFDFTKKKKITSATEIEYCEFHLGEFIETDRWSGKNIKNWR